MRGKACGDSCWILWIHEDRSQDHSYISATLDNRQGYCHSFKVSDEQQIRERGQARPGRVGGGMDI
eukprot:scaffold536102_cov41-Prasinocladus_malaysianus.AAC.1